MRRPPDLSHPVMLGALAVLVANDHWWKYAFHSWLTGKLSDVAGLIFFPVLASSLTSLLLRSARRRLVACTIATIVVFAWTKGDPAGTGLYREALSRLQWPLHAIAAVVGRRPVPALANVAAVTDPTDLIALPFALTGLILATAPSRLAVARRRRSLRASAA